MKLAPILPVLLLLAGVSPAQAPLSSSASPQTLDTGYGRARFLIDEPLAARSEALRLNDDRAGKDGLVPPPSPGWRLFAAVVVESDDTLAVQDLARAYGAGSVEALEAAPGFWLVRAASILQASDLAEVYKAAFGPGRAYLDSEPPRTLRVVPNDPMYGDQWHLENNLNPVADCNAPGAWNAGYTGTGVVVGVLEGGWQTNHPDLAANYNAAASQSGGSSSHGTSVAGVVAAVGNNGTGVVGVAYEAQISRQYFGSSSSTAAAFNYRNDLNDIKSNSWGPFDDGTITYLSSVERAALENSVATGRGGLGEIFAWAAGNGGTGDRVEYDPYASSRLTLAIGAIGDNDTRAWYNETGSSMLVVAHSSGNSRGITTTASGGSYTSNFGGTSSASPLGAGVVALMLEANPALTWRDVQHVLIHAARKNHPGASGWSTNGAGLDINYNYGFGAVTAGAATALAAGWANVGPQVIHTSGRLPVNRTIPDNNATGISEAVTLAQDLVVEHVEVILNVNTTYVGDLRIELTSPDGTGSLLAKSRSDSQNNLVNYIFTSLRHWDEHSAGTWTLRIADEGAGDIATWVDWELKIYGTDPGTGGSMTLTVSPLTANQIGTFDVTLGDPNTSTHLFYGKSAGSTFVPALNVTLGLRRAKEPAPPEMSDPFGAAQWNFLIPNKAAQRSFVLQAAQFGRVSSVVPVFVN